MRRPTLVAGLITFGLIFVAGCGPSPSQPPEPIKGMNPAEYREKAELDQAIQSKVKKTGGKVGK